MKNINDLLKMINNFFIKLSLVKDFVFVLSCFPCYCTVTWKDIDLIGQVNFDYNKK